MLEDDVVIPTIRAPNEIKALDSSFDEIAVAFTLEELLPSGQAWEPSGVDICRMVAAEIVEEALVRTLLAINAACVHSAYLLLFCGTMQVEAVDAADTMVVAQTVRDMVDVLECVDDLVEDVVFTVERVWRCVSFLRIAVMKRLCAGRGGTQAGRRTSEVCGKTRLRLRCGYNPLCRCRSAPEAAGGGGFVCVSLTECGKSRRANMSQHYQHAV